jgi:hypothetical protein
MNRRMSVLDMASSGLSIPPNVLRMPKGPDKGKGFQKWCRSRMTTETPSAAPLAPAVVKKSHAVPIVAPPTAEEEEEVKKETVAIAIKETPKIKVTPADEDAEVAEVAVEDGAAAAAAPVIVDASDDGGIGDSGNEDEGSFSDHDAVAAAAAAVAGGIAAALSGGENEKTR